MKTRSRSALVTIRTRIGRRRRASAQDWVRLDTAHPAERLDMAESRVWPPQCSEARGPRPVDPGAAHEREIQSWGD